MVKIIPLCRCIILDGTRYEYFYVCVSVCMWWRGRVDLCVRTIVLIQLAERMRLIVICDLHGSSILLDITSYTARFWKHRY